MKIAYIVPSLANKGPVIVVKELVEQMVENGHECIVLYFDEIKQLNFNCPTQRIKNSIIDFSSFDIVHSHGIRPDIYVYMHRKEIGKARCISTLHNYMFQDLKYQYNSIVAYVVGKIWIQFLKKHDKIVALSEDAVHYYSKWIKQNKLTFVYNTRNLDVEDKLGQNEIQQILDFKGDSILIGVNAVLSDRKGLDILIKALNKLPDCKVYMVGNGPARKFLERLARKYGVINRCRFVGYKQDAFRYLKYYDIFAMPSRSEGFPLALLEAAIYRKASVVSNIPIIKEAFSPDEVAFFDLMNPDTIVQAVLKAIDNKQLGGNMHKRYLAEYSPTVMYEKYMNIYLNNNHSF